MNRELFERLFTPETLTATGPFLALSAGVLLLLLIEILPGTRLLRAPLFLAALAAGAWLAVQQLALPETLVLEGTFVTGPVTAWWSLIFLSSTAIAWAFGRNYYREEAPLQGEHDALMLTAAAGMLVMAGARDLLVFFVGLELLSVPLYALSGFRRNRSDSVEAGLKYFVLGAFAAAIFLFGAALVYAGTGTLTFSRMPAAHLSDPLTITGAALLAASLFFKVSVFPFHLWVPDVYQGAPGPVTTFMATGTKSAAFAFLLPAAFLLPSSAAMLLAVIALLTMAAGNLGALVQTDVKRLLAYSGVAHAGTILLALAAWLAGGRGIGSADATRAVLFYLAAYVFTAGGAFGLVTLLESNGVPVTLSSLRGLAKRRPGIAAALTVFMLSLGGIPATGGFLGKYLVFALAVQAELIAVAVIGVLLSVVALGYYLRIVIAMYMQEAEGETVPEPSRALPGVAAALCAGVVLALGILPGWLLDRLG